MLSNFLKVTLRTLYREKVYAIINIAGLSLAIACCLILGLWLRSELTYDRYNIRHKEIFRVADEFGFNGKGTDIAVTPQLLGPILTEEYADVKGFVRFKPIPAVKVMMRYKDKVFYWDNVLFASDNIFDVFTYKIIYGNPKTALVDPTSIAVSQTFARKYFGDTNPVGKTMDSEAGKFKITLVFADLPENSHLRYNLLLSYNNERVKDPDDLKSRNNSLWNFSDYTYLLMPEGYDVKDFQKISDSFFKRHMEEDGDTSNTTWRCWLQPLTDVHYSPPLMYDQPAGNKFYLYGFAASGNFHHAGSLYQLYEPGNCKSRQTRQRSRYAKDTWFRQITSYASVYRRVCVFLIYFSVFRSCPGGSRSEIDTFKPVDE